MRFQSYFNTAVLLIRQYDGTVPLVYFLKQYFAQHKKHGSRDRKCIAHLCYAYYRLGHAVQELATEERVKIAMFLCNDSVGNWNLLYNEEWVHNWSDKLSERIDFVRTLHASFSPEAIFPWLGEVSDAIDRGAFSISHLVQPDLFLRIRPGKKMAVQQKLADHQIKFKLLSESCLVLPNASKMDTVLDIDREVVVQDYSSQRVAEFLLSLVNRESLVRTVWDCCAASGGKSILAYDVLPDIHLTVSDIRPSIIQNLKKRFERAGIQSYHSFVYDLTKGNIKIQNSKFKIIICDAPCSGSGTWSRTPEQLYFFSKEKISEYAALQKKIVSNVIPQLEEDGYLLYITCSVFKEENERMLDFLKEKFQLDTVKVELLKGYDRKADTMFAALLKKR